MPHPVRIVFVTGDSLLADHVQLRLQSRDYQVTSMARGCDALSSIFNDPPDLVLVDLSTDGDDRTAMVLSLRSDSYFSTIPVIGLFTPSGGERKWERCPLDDFLQLPVNYDELFNRITLALFRIKRIFDNNPLTHLPGNTSIQRAVDEALGKPLAVCYVDINHFKPYNDAYGFAHGDEVLRMLARIMFNAVRETGGGFCGHVGGDDFVYIVPMERAESVSQTIIAHFDRIVLDLYDVETRRRGFYSGVNRRGEQEQFPLLSISIGVVPTDAPHIRHFVRISEVAAELKIRAKESKTSCYVVERRFPSP